MTRMFITKNHIFREFECNLSIEETAELCFKHIKTVKEWDKGRAIPPECKRLMRMYRTRDASKEANWHQFKITNGMLELPTGLLITPQQILLGAALITEGSESTRKTSLYLMKTARALANILVLRSDFSPQNRERR
ncbi:regulator [Vibrio ziniensis]|uniref:Regulator n=1 Tax=Vibrio ziniensis TaxID=2711221 RepID=A0A6G7CQ90_9VIBR|nr:regulator [Vibrio ziniensis]QIH44223.1 regulator [Vibrio ziniensis]